MCIFKKILARLDKNMVDMRMERYLAKSIDHSDLEHRERKWMNMNEYDRDYWGSR